MKKRLSYLDISRFFAIFFIVIGHSLVHSEHCTEIVKFLYSFHVVLFFIISGMTHSQKEASYKLFIKKKFYSLMVPYFIWAVLFIIPYLIFGNSVSNFFSLKSTFNILDLFCGILYGNGNGSAIKQNSPLWFLPALFTIECFYYLIIKMKEKYRINDFFIIMFLFIIGIVSSNYLKIVFPWGINTMLNIGIFYYLGYCIKTYEKLIINKRIVFILALLFIGMLFSIMNKNGVSCMEYFYGIYVYFIISGLFLSIVILNVSKMVNAQPLFEYIGKNTMEILVFHKVIITIVQTKMGIISSMLISSNLVVEVTIGILVSIITIAFSLGVGHLLKKYVPFTLGKKKESV